MDITPDDKLLLQRMVDANECENNTEKIRTLRHSQQIKSEVQNLLLIKQKYARMRMTNPTSFDNLCISRCSFLHQNYTDIFNRVKNDELNLNLLGHLIDILSKIEDGKVDQHEASVMVGTLLKEMYVDSALRKSKKLDEKGRKGKKDKKKPTEVSDAPRNISWEQYARMTSGDK